MPAGSFTADITAIRKRARQKMEEGPVTGSYGKDPKEVIAVLNKSSNSDDDERTDVWAAKLSLCRLKLAIKYEQKQVHERMGE